MAHEEARSRDLAPRPVCRGIVADPTGVVSGVSLRRRRASVSNYGFKTNDENHDGHTLHPCNQRIRPDKHKEQAAEEAAGVQRGRGNAATRDDLTNM